MGTILSNSFDSGIFFSRKTIWRTLVGQITNSISDMASVINKLALNATIEVAIAGEAGRGLAVLASGVVVNTANVETATKEIIEEADTVGRTAESVVSKAKEIARVAENC